MRIADATPGNAQEERMLAPVVRHEPLNAQQLQDTWSAIASALDAFKGLVHCAERELRRSAALDQRSTEAVRSAFAAVVIAANEQLGTGSSVDEGVRELLGGRLQAELLPYLELSTNGARWLDKPRGYAGDFATIDSIYRDEPQGVGRIGALVDRCFLDLPACRAVRNRRSLLVNEIQRTLGVANDREVRVTSLACGPAREVFDAYAAEGRSPRLRITVLDADLRALADVADERDRAGLRKNMTVVHANLIHVARKTRELRLEEQDLVYSVGLIDYFSDTLVIELMDWAYEQLRPGGRLILGNFHPRNPSRAVMDHVLEWRLVHRDEHDMDLLFRKSRFGRPPARVVYEEEEINLFAVGER
jgi:extracellular factor (EF) 3-hydroxypalmitic acid methyl ester biosynthesis protein